jgi:hypothetical protein
MQLNVICTSTNYRYQSDAQWVVAVESNAKCRK